jgi:hypothetical protein
MKKSEMPARCVEDRRIFLQDLARAGWNAQGWDEVLAAGADVDPEAEATYAGPVFDLLLEYHAEHAYLVLGMVQRQGALVVRLRLHPRDDIGPLLARIVASQDTIDAENHTEFVKSLIPLCEPLLIETDEGLYRLSL